MEKTGELYLPRKQKELHQMDPQRFQLTPLGSLAQGTL